MMKRSLLLVLIYLCAARGVAVQFESHFYLAMKRATAPDQLERVKKDYERWKITHAACLIELREQILPSSCYEELRWSASDSRRKQQLISRLDRVCAKVSRSLSVPLHLHPALSRECAKNVRESMAIQAYRREGSADHWSEN